MQLYCPHCLTWFSVHDPFSVAGDSACPLCGKAIYVEIGESEEGPTFTAYKEMPPCDLHPPEKQP